MINIIPFGFKHEPKLGTGFWVGVDLDGTLAHYGEYRGHLHIGEPIGLMVDRVKAMLSGGWDVRIFTARVDGGKCARSMGLKHWVDFADTDKIVRAIESWCMKHIGQPLPVTNVKDFGCVALFDDRAVGVEFNTGKLVTNNSYDLGYKDGRYDLCSVAEYGRQ